MHINHNHGFTLVEMIAVIVILSVLAFVAVPRFMDGNSVNVRGFYDQAQAVIRYAQKMAIAKRGPVFVQIAANTIRVCFDAACTALVPDPADSGSGLVVTAPNGVAITPPALPVFAFDASGRPANTTMAVLSSNLLVGIAGKNITIERETGYVHS